jgi:hypothetical protein
MALLRVWHRWRFKRQRRRLEVDLFNTGSYRAWQRVRDENSRLGVWRRRG